MYHDTVGLSQQSDDLYLGVKWSKIDTLNLFKESKEKILYYDHYH